MNEQSLIEALATSCANQAPSHVDVIGLQPLSIDDLRGRAQLFLTKIQQEDECSHDRADWTVKDDHTVITLAGGARAVVHHASGALQYKSALAPLQALFEQVQGKEELTRLVIAAAQKLGISDWAGTQGRIAFERLFQVKAQGADRAGKTANAVLARALGAFRHFVGDVPVLGGASVAVKLAGDGTLDALSVLVRPVAAEIVDKAVVIDPELAARQIALQLGSLLGQSRERSPAPVIESQVMRFGYLDLGKRKAQRLFAPAFVAQIVLRHKTNRQAYVLAVPGTEKPYMQISNYGTEALAMRSRSASHECKDVIR